MCFPRTICAVRDKYCKCGHPERAHDMGAPVSKQKCLTPGCNCKQFEEAK